MKKRKLLYIPAVILAVLFLTIFALPKIFSTKKGKDFLLKKIISKANIKIDADSFQLSWLGPQTIKNLKYGDSNLDIRVDSISSNMALLSFYKSFKHQKIRFTANTDINDLNADFHYPDLPKACVYNVFAHVKADKNAVDSINITGKTKEDNKTGDINANIRFKNDKIVSKIAGTNIPTILIDKLLFHRYKNYQNSLVALLGSFFNIEIDSFLENLTGPININLNSAYSKAKASFLYKKENITLNSPAAITINLQNAPVFLSKKNPSIKSVEPIFIKITEKDFNLPISPFNLDKLKMKASIDLNKMIVSNSGIIKTITSLANIAASEFVSLWFTGLNIQVENKMLYTDRADFLINDEMHLCFWGKLDLFDHNIRFNLGIPSDTLTAFFGIKNLHGDYVIKIPISGSLENPKIDVKAATAKIFALSALQSGKGLGSIIGGVITRMQKDENIPAAKKPFPWEGKIQKKSRLGQPIDLEKIFENFK